MKKILYFLIILCPLVTRAQFEPPCNEKILKSLSFPRKDVRDSLIGKAQPKGAMQLLLDLSGCDTALVQKMLWKNNCEKVTEKLFIEDSYPSSDYPELQKCVVRSVVSGDSSLYKAAQRMLEKYYSPEMEEAYNGPLWDSCQRSHYDHKTLTLFIQTNDTALLGANINSLLGELAHHIQYMNDSARFNRLTIEAEKRTEKQMEELGLSHQCAYDSFEYEDTASLEYQAHRIIQPQLVEEFVGYANKYSNESFPDSTSLSAYQFLNSMSEVLFNLVENTYAELMNQAVDVEWYKKRDYLEEVADQSNSILNILMFYYYW